MRNRTVRAPLNNPRINAISKIAYGIAGNHRKFYMLTKDERTEVRQTATQLFDLGADFVSAVKAQATEKRGFVYVIHHPAFPGYVKIGRAFNPESRLASYQTGCPHRAYRLYAAVYFEDCHFAEQEIHARLENQHRHGALGEWFKVSPFIARHNINKLRSII